MKIKQKPSLHHRWEGFLGERKVCNGDHQEAIFSVCRSSIIGRSSLVVEVCRDPREEYCIEGNYPQRRCKIYSGGASLENSLKQAVAEIKRKVDPSTHMLLGKDVFWLCVQPGLDAAFAMGLVLVLDQIYGDDDGGRLVDPTLENATSSS